MSHNKYLGILGVAGLMSWLAFVVVIFKLDVYESLGLGMAFFFVSLFLALSCTFAIIGFYLRVWLNHNEIYYNHINISLRQGVLLSIVAIGCLAFQLILVLTWWTGLLLVGAAALVEFYFTAKE